ncbi:Hypothetical_protein [Hexamita inflata]|uniref:Hypothetical_protein n=1 Tax=Hexamita inflata TaxID=28002 RepID=A0AA86R1Y8_9EUKA|nr:Hypothetical protein HINF_LOCUS53126 [Hexamita inflata]
MISNEIYSNALFTSSFNKSYVVHSSGEMFDFSGFQRVKKWIQVWTHYWKAIELNVVSSIKVFHILTKMCRGVILLQLQVMLLSDGSVTCLRTQELTIEFMVVPHGINHNGPLYLQLIVLQIMHENSPYFTLRENTSDSTRLQVF